MGDKQKKKMTKKELKALNHAKLMASKKSQGPVQPNNNVVEFKKPEDQKKAA